MTGFKLQKKPPAYKKKRTSSTSKHELLNFSFLVGLFRLFAFGFQIRIQNIGQSIVYTSKKMRRPVITRRTKLLEKLVSAKIEKQFSVNFAKQVSVNIVEQIFL